VAKRDSRLDGRLLERFSHVLLEWFRANKRVFPWRVGRRTPYRIALAEALLQKTNVEKVVPIFQLLFRRFPTVKKLSAANPKELADILRPLGLPRRATLLHQLAVRVVAERRGVFPSSELELRKLPGIGPYGAGAIASQAFHQRAPMIDINVMRIFHRVFSTDFNPRSGPSKELRELALKLMPQGSEDAFNLALIDFGALVCRSRNPKHDTCPLASFCNFNLARLSRKGVELENGQRRRPRNSAKRS
jgi:A/G-specific adenine glycosylase